MSYTIRTRDQVTPKFVVRQGPKEAVSRLNEVPVPINPLSFTKIIYDPLFQHPENIYEPDPIGRTELWEDVNGTATWEDIKTQTGVIAYLQLIVKAKAKQVIESKWPLWAQNNCALGIYDSTTIDQCKADIAAVITASNAAEDAINNAVSLDAALAVVPAWPAI